MISRKEFFDANEEALNQDQVRLLGPVMEAVCVPLNHENGREQNRATRIQTIFQTLVAMDELLEAFGEERFAPVMKPNGDMVMRPNHYGRLKIEPTRFNRENGVSWNLGNAIKYLCRYPFKNGFEDVRKARRFLELEIKYLQGVRDWSM